MLQHVIERLFDGQEDIPAFLPADLAGWDGSGHNEDAVDGGVFEEFDRIGADIGDQVFDGIVGAGHGPDDGVHLIEQFVGGVGDLIDFGKAGILHFAFDDLGHQPDSGHAGAQLIVHVDGDAIAFVLFGGQHSHLFLHFLSFGLELVLFFLLDASGDLAFVLIGKGKEEEEQFDGDTGFVVKEGEVKDGGTLCDLDVGGDQHLGDDGKKAERDISHDDIVHQPVMVGEPFDDEADGNQQEHDLGAVFEGIGDAEVVGEAIEQNIGHRDGRDSDGPQNRNRSRALKYRFVSRNLRWKTI